MRSRTKGLHSGSPAYGRKAPAGVARRQRRQKSKRRFFPTCLFAITLAGICTFLYFFALPDRAASSPLVSKETGGDVRNTDVRNIDVRNIVEKTRDSGVIYNNVSGSRVVVSGTGRISENTAQGRLLARRAALTDARRNLLVLRQKLLKDPRFKSSGAVSGTLVAPSQAIRSERVEGGLFFLELDVRLDELLNTAFDEKGLIALP
ncbi:MAG: hypothetical protein LBQ90_02455 [Synergistaceae bacterium]|jgi:hypothetical protein|nr:hypothetical protein [Synergistaceae bacterium]